MVFLCEKCGVNPLGDRRYLDGKWLCPSCIQQECTHEGHADDTLHCRMCGADLIHWLNAYTRKERGDTRPVPQIVADYERDLGKRLNNRLSVAVAPVTLWDDEYETDYRKNEEFLIQSGAIPYQPENARYFDRK
jgi:hypothetical protein